MNKVFLIIVGIILVVTTPIFGQSPVKTSNPADEWTIKWSVSDEFKNGSPDWAKWKKDTDLPHTGTVRWDNDKNVIQDGENARLILRQNANNAKIDGSYLSSACLKSYNKFKYGYFEARIKGANFDGSGVCPAFWLYSFGSIPVNGHNVTYNEIDIVELQQFDWYEGHQDDVKDMDLNLHCIVDGSWRRPKAYPAQQLNKWRAPWDPRNDFHVYGCEVNEDEIIWYIDGEEVARKENLWWHMEMNVVLSMAPRKPFVEFFNNRNNPIDPESTSQTRAALNDLPTTMYVDYVRVWEKSGTNNNPSLEVGEIGNAGFESGTLAYWNAGSGNTSVVNSGARSGSHCAKVTNASVAQIVELEPNTNYTLKSYGKVGAGASSAYMGVSEAVSNKLVENYEFTGSNYEQGTISFSTGSQSESYRIWFWSADEAYVDDFVLLAGFDGGNGSNDGSDNDSDNGTGCIAPAWEPQAYQQGDRVIYNGRLYEVKWASGVKTGGCVPGSCAGWTSLGVCTKSASSGSAFIVPEDNSNIQNLRVYPNPVINGILNVEFPEGKEEVTVSIFNLSGAEVLQRIYTNQKKITINFSELDHEYGVFFMQVRSGNDVFHEKLIVQ